MDEDLGWIREDDDGHASLEDTPFSPTDTDESRSTTTEERSSPSTSTPVTPVRQEYFTFNASHKQASTASKGLTRRFKSSDATVLDAARRISAIFINESQNLSQAYQPFCSGHSEAMEVVKTLSTSATKSDWDAFESQCTAHLASRRKKRSSHDSTSSSSRLHFADFLIKPVQRICRYPLLFGSLLKNAQKTSLGRSSAYSQYSVASTPMTGYTADVNLSIDRIRQALEIAKEVASGVDHAQKQRSLEVATVKLARRIEVQTVSNCLCSAFAKISTSNVCVPLRSRLNMSSY